MKQIPIILVIFLILAIGLAGYKAGADNSTVIERYIPIESTDSIVHKVNNTKHIIDSLTNRCDSLTGELQVATYKLERIRYYNDIAKKGNNLKFLRGWIRRVLDDNE